jgi:acetolactate synthase-1/2/3 large subunit
MTSPARAPLLSRPAPARSVAELLLGYLKAEEVGAVFGLPGGPATPLFDALLREPALRTVVARHEAGAAFMALGAARATGRLGVCLLTTGPGATNAVTAVAAAKSDGLPLLVLTAQVAAASFGKGSLQDSSDVGVDTVSIFRPVTKLSALLASPANAGSLMRQALRTAMTGRRGPVHLSVPADLMRRAAPDAASSPCEYRPRSRVFDRAAVETAARLLTAARRPAILAGHGTLLAGAEPELQELAELVGAPVATTPKGKGAFPETHPLALRVFGLASSPRAARVLLSPETDLLLVVGSSLHENSCEGWDPRLAAGRTLIQQDIEPAVIGRNYPVSAAMVGDAKTTLSELLLVLRRRRRGRPARPAPPDADAPPWLPLPAPSDGPLKPQRLMRALDAALPERARVILDVGSHALWATHYLTANGRNSFAHNWGEFAAMGYGVASCVGAAIAAPGRPVVAIVGDGGFAMLGMEVSTAVTHRVPVVWVVLNDGRLNAVHHGQRLQYEGRTAGTEFRRIDAAGVAAALGAWSLRVEREAEVGPALAAALASGRAAVLDVRIDPDEAPPLESRVRALERHFGGENP